jgi:hypothetical protein
MTPDMGGERVRGTDAVPARAARIAPVANPAHPPRRRQPMTQISQRAELTAKEPANLPGRKSSIARRGRLGRPGKPFIRKSHADHGH